MAVMCPMNRLVRAKEEKKRKKGEERKREERELQGPLRRFDQASGARTARALGFLTSAFLTQLPRLCATNGWRE
jgi:hypothetical protein